MTTSDRKGVDTRETNSAETAGVDVDSVVTKRKVIRSRRNLWITRIIPVELEASACKIVISCIFIFVFHSDFPDKTFSRLFLSLYPELISMDSAT